MKILLLGKNGQVGWELQRALSPLGDLVALDRAGQGGLSGDLHDLEALRRTLAHLQPDIVVNAAAYTAVDKAESEPEVAQRINADAPGILAEWAADTGAWLVHYSTDYVFDGSGDVPWCETDATGPLSVYGRTKLAGEESIVGSGCRHLIFRTSWVYGARGNNFARTMLRLAADRDELRVVNDQIGAPTSAELLADVSALALRSALQSPEQSGLYHLAASGALSWHDYATFVIEWARAHGQVLKVRSVEPIPSSEFPVPARRPLNSRLNCDKLCATFRLQMPDWRQGVERMLMETQGA